MCLACAIRVELLLCSTNGGRTGGSASPAKAGPPTADSANQARRLYDAWGRQISKTGTLASTLGTLNPLRYRGYVYDEETGLYYLRSRYYNPNWGRFVSSDSLLGVAGGLLQHNVFAYCANNPTVRKDIEGNFWETAFDVASLIASAVEVVVNPTDLSAWIGLLGDTVDLIPFVTGVGETIRALRVADKVADVADIGFDTYKNLRKMYAGMRMQVHHIFEKRFLKYMHIDIEDINPMNILSKALTPEKHAAYTSAFRSAIKYGTQWGINEGEKMLKDILEAGIKAYKEDPDL